MFTLSERARRKGIANTQKLLGQGTVHRYAVAIGGPYPTTVRWGALGIWLVLTILSSAAAGGFVAPGIAVILIALWAINPPRAVAVSDQGLLLVRRSLWTARPDAILSMG